LIDVGSVVNAIQLPMLIGALAYFVRSEIRKNADALKLDMKLDNAALRLELSTEQVKRSSEIAAEQKVSGQVHIDVDRRISALERIYSDVPRLLQAIMGELKRMGARSVGGGSGGPPEGSVGGGVGVLDV
jgi:hypothetical protein